MRHTSRHTTAPLGTSTSIIWSGLPTKRPHNFCDASLSVFGLGDELWRKFRVQDGRRWRYLTPLILRCDAQGRQGEGALYTISRPPPSHRWRLLCAPVVAEPRRSSGRVDPHPHTLLDTLKWTRRTRRTRCSLHLLRWPRPLRWWTGGARAALAASHSACRTSFDAGTPSGMR